MSNFVFCAKMGPKRKTGIEPHKRGYIPDGAAASFLLELISIAYATDKATKNKLISQ